MARLPDYTALGERPSLAVNRAIARIDTSGIGEGAKAAAEGEAEGLRRAAEGARAEGKGHEIEGAAYGVLGDAAELTGRSKMQMGRGLTNAANSILSGLDRFERQREQERKEEQALELARADAAYLTGRVGIDQERDEDHEPEGFAKRYLPRYGENLQAAAAHISDPQQRELFLLRRQADVAQSGARSADRETTLVKDRTLAQSQQELDDLRQKGLKATDEGTRVEILNAGKNVIAGLARRGLIDETKAQALAKSWADNYVVGSLEAMGPSARAAALRGPVKLDERSKAAYDFFIEKGWKPHQAAGIVGNLLAESQLYSAARNKGDGRDGSDSIGIAQWNADRAERLKKFAAERGADWHDYKTQLAFVDLELRSTHVSPKLLGATNAREASEAFITDFEKPAGSQKGATFAHNYAGRVAGAEAVLSQYGGGNPPAPDRGSQLAALLPEDKRVQLLERAEEEDRQLAYQVERESEAEQRNMLASVKKRVEDDVASMEGHGRGLPDLRREEVAAVMGEEAAQEWERDRARSRRVFEALDGIRERSETEIYNKLAALEPQPGTAGYLEDYKAYERARKQADEILNKRRSDPALEMGNIPAVRDVLKAAEYEGEGENRRMKPESRQAITQARLRAQRQLGIENPMAVTRAEAAVLARELRYIGEDNKPALDRFNRQVQSQYGDFTDEVISSVLQLENVNRDLAVVETELVRRLGISSLPDPELARRVETQRHTAALSDAMTGKVEPTLLERIGFAPAPLTQAPAGNSAGNVRRATAAAASEKPPQKVAEVGPFSRGSATPASVRALDEGRYDPTQFDIDHGAGSAAAVKKELARRRGGGKGQ